MLCAWPGSAQHARTRPPPCSTSGGARGIARALVEEGERRLRTRGAARAHLIVLDHRDGAAAFWRSLGYDRHPAAGRYRKPLD